MHDSLRRGKRGEWRRNARGLGEGGTHPKALALGGGEELATRECSLFCLQPPLLSYQNPRIAPRRVSQPAQSGVEGAARQSPRVKGIHLPPAQNALHPERRPHLCLSRSDGIDYLVDNKLHQVWMASCN